MEVCQWAVPMPWSSRGFRLVRRTDAAKRRCSRHCLVGVPMAGPREKDVWMSRSRRAEEAPFWKQTASMTSAPLPDGRDLRGTLRWGTGSHIPESRLPTARPQQGIGLSPLKRPVPRAYPSRLASHRRGSLSSAAPTSAVASMARPHHLRPTTYDIRPIANRPHPCPMPAPHA